uniref:Amino acid transporter transmembrane domain-containing protein n=1 Tax=Oryza glaberrima TaxID=4538 RepID=I1PUW5_ORYGL
QTREEDLVCDMEQQLFPTDGVSFCITGASFRRSCLNFSNLYLVAISFLILEGDNLDKLLPSTVVEILGYQVHGKQLFVLATAAVILPMTWLKNLSMLTYVSVVGLISLNYAVTVVLRYLIYGEDVQSQVTQNLPTGKLYTRIAILTTLITPLANYTLVIQPVTTAIEEKLSATTDVENNWLTRVLTSIAIVISTVVLACTVPFFGYLMLFIGSSLNVSVAVLVPCLSYLKIYMFRGGVGCFERTMIVGILVIGVCVNVVGTYTSLHQIIGTF